MSYTGIFATNCGRAPAKNFAGASPMMNRTRHIARAAVTSVQVMFPNWLVNWTASSYVEAGNGGTATITAGIEYNGTTVQVLWSGSPSTTIASGGQSALSDAVSISIPAGAVFFVRSYYVNASGILSATGTNIPDANSTAAEDQANGEDLWFGAGCVDITTSTGAITSGGSNGVGLIYGPVAIVSTVDDSFCSWLLIGDSRCQGIRDAYTGASGDKGETARAVGTAWGYTNVGVPGDRASAFIASHTNREALKAYCSHVLCEYGINDVVGDSAATVKTNLETIGGYFTGKQKYQSTLPPKNLVSSDSWATTAGQTIDSRNTERVTLNNSIRAGLTGFNGYFEIADVLESARDSGKWAVNGSPNYLTNDGIHEVNTANILVANSAVPGAPTIGTASATGATTASVAFTGPASVGLSAITHYTATASPGGVTATGSSSPIAVSGLTGGQSYTFTVAASNILGTGPASSASNSVNMPSASSSRRWLLPFFMQ